MAKLLLTVLLIGAALWALKTLRGVGARRRDAVAEAARRATLKRAEAETLESCPVCGTYFPAGQAATACERADCPHRTPPAGASAAN